MSELTVFQNKAPAAAFGGVDPRAESLSDGLSGGFPVLHYKGKNWSLNLRGESYDFVRQDDGTPLAYIDAIILRRSPVKSHTYYEKGAWERGETGGPLCSSLDGVVPDANATKPQSATCALCPRYAVQTRPDGSKGRECRDNRRLALLLVPSLSKRLLGEALMEPILLRVPAASLVALSKMGDDAARQGWPYYSFITRIGFVAGKPYPELTFKPLEVLTEKEAPVVLEMREDAQSLRITGEDELNKPRAIATEPARGPSIVRDNAFRNAALADDSDWDPQAIKREAQGAPVLPIKKTVPPPVTLDLEANDDDDLGFGDINEKPLAQPSPIVKPAVKKPSNVVKLTAPEPVEEVEEASADLDARIANLLKTD